MDVQQMLAQLLGIPQAAAAGGGMPTEPGIDQLLQQSQQFSAPAVGRPGGAAPPPAMPPSGGVMEMLRRLLSGNPMDGNDRPAVDLARAPATGVVRTDPSGAVRRPTDFAAGNAANERPGVPGDVLTQLRNDMSAAMPGPPGAPTNVDGMDQRPARFVQENGRLQPNVPPFPAPQPRVATDQDAPMAERITRGAEQAQAARAASTPGVVDVLRHFLDSLSGVADIRPGDSKAVAFAKGAGGSGKGRREREDRELRNRLATQAGERAERGDTRAERADTRAEETHKLTTQRIVNQLVREMGGQVTGAQRQFIEQEVGRRLGRMRQGAVSALSDADARRIIADLRKDLEEQFRSTNTLPGTAPVGGLPAPVTGGAAATSGGGRPAAPARTPAAGGVPEGQTATNPTTGEKLIFRDGQWQPHQ